MAVRRIRNPIGERVEGRGRTGWTAVALIAALGLSAVACRTPEGDTPDQQRSSVRKMRSAALGDLYAEQPATKALIDRSVGYAVFSTIGTNFGLVSTARGYGVLRDKSSSRDTFMKMFSLGGGVGLGIKDVRILFVFLDRDAMDRFLDTGLDFSGQAEAAARTAEEEGIAINRTENLESVQAKIMVFQLTKAGLAGQATLQGTRYAVDDELN